MALKKQRGNMYEFVTHMWSPIKGKCSHDCSYCYMKRWKLPPLHIDKKEMRTNLGEGNFIFVCHTCDMFAEDVPKEWITRVLSKCQNYFNSYLFQTKNPSRLFEFLESYPPKRVYGTTIETNRNIVKTNAPPVFERAKALSELRRIKQTTMVTIEPIFDFDLDDLVELVVLANPEWVNIGADSKGHNLPEPSAEKVKMLIEILQEKTTVKLKRNLQRIYR